MENRHTKEELRYMQSLPLDLKIRLTEDRIRAWVDKYGEDGVCVSFSGGKDSTVLLDIVRNLYPDVKAVFSNTGLEYPEIRQFALSHDNVDIVYPTMRFKDVITQFGYPLISKEVAEAIFYARRIGGGVWKHTDNAKPYTESGTIRQTSNGGGVWSDYHRRCLQPDPSDPKDRECFYHSKLAEDATIFTDDGKQLVHLPKRGKKTARTPRLPSRGDGEYP